MDFTASELGCLGDTSSNKESAVIPDFYRAVTHRKTECEGPSKQCFFLSPSLYIKMFSLKIVQTQPAESTDVITFWEYGLYGGEILLLWESEGF